jgi:ubiquinone biosynthesis protein
MPSVLWETLSAARDLGRLHDIASVLVRYGFSDVVRRLGLAGVLERADKTLHREEVGALALLEPPARVRRALEDLGPTFIKLGQMLATRMDMFPPEWIAEFEKLQDQAPAVPFEDIRKQLCEDLGAEPEEVFSDLDTEPLAAASIAQVHRARLRDGTEVVVKVRRPGIRPLVEADLRLLQRLAKIFAAESSDMARFKPQEVVRQFTASLRRELDLATECRNAERIAGNCRDHPEIVIPRIYWEWTGERLNIQEAIHGISGRDVEAAERAGLDRKILARHGAQAMLRMIIEDGFFHADPHQGNYFYLPENRIALIDFGLVGRLSQERRDQVVNLLQGTMEREAERVTDVLLEWTDDTGVDRDALQREVDALIDQYHGVPLKELDLRTMSVDLTALLRDHHLTLPPDLLLLIKALVSLEGMGRRLDPDFDVATEFSPFLRRAMLARYAPDVLLKRGWRTITEGLDILIGLPRDLRRLVRSARSGKLQLRVDVDRLQPLANQLDRAISRMTLGLVIAALIVGSSIVMTVDQGPLLLGLPLFSLLGFGGAALAGIWLLVSIIRSGKSPRR